MPAKAKKIIKKKVTKIAPKTNRVVKSLQSQTMKSFRIVKNTEKFVTFRLTRQTLYWFILLVYILVLDVWVIDAQVKAAMFLI